MPFHKIANSLAAIPYDANDNFLFVAQGSIFPRTGEDLEATTGAYDIGSATKKFNDVYISGQLNYSGTSTYSGSWQEMARYIFSVNTSSISIDVNSDNDKNYRLVHISKSNTITSSYTYLFFNGLSSGALYGYNVYCGASAIPNDKNITNDDGYIIFDYALDSDITRSLAIVDIYSFGNIKHYTATKRTNSQGLTTTTFATHQMSMGRMLVNTISNIKIEYSGSTITADNTGTTVILYRTQ